MLDPCKKGFRVHLWSTRSCYSIHADYQRVWDLGLAYTTLIQVIVDRADYQHESETAPTTNRDRGSRRLPIEIVDRADYQRVFDLATQYTLRVRPQELW